MKAFALLLERLVFTPSRNGKLRLLAEYFRATPDPDRGWALAALTDGVNVPHAKPAMMRALVEERVDPVLFRYSYDFVGDLAETVSLIWPGAGSDAAPSVGTVVDTLRRATKLDVPGLIAGWLDAMEPGGRFALLKLLLGGLRVGVSARLAKTALAEMGGVDLAEVEEVWHGLEPPYESLFAWLDGQAERPGVAHGLAFRLMMLANPIAEDDFPKLDPADFLAEWKWDGIRVQLVSDGHSRRIYSRTGEDICGSFPDIVDVMDFDAVLDGELLVAHEGTIASFNDLQQRLGRKAVGRSLLAAHPAHVRLYDILFDGAEDLRPQPLTERRRRLEAWYRRVVPDRMDLSDLIPFQAWPDLAALRDDARAAGIEGLMLKRKDSAYLSGRPKGPWFKWKRNPLTADCVLMYAQRGHGKRSSFYSDYTFGCWRDGEAGAAELVPVGKAYFGFTDAELRELDKWVRENTVERFGPVRSVRPGLVLEIAFDAVQRSARHKSKVAMRFPRVSRIRWDKPAEEADRLETLEALIEA